MGEELYCNHKLKFPLLRWEYKYIDQVWKFYETMQRSDLYLSEHRRHVISKIRQMYTLSEFYIYEMILNKLYWNIRWLVFQLWISPSISRVEYQKFLDSNYGNQKEIPYELTLCRVEKLTSDVNLEEKIREFQIEEDGYYRSFINKMIIIDKKQKILYLKPIEGSSDLLAKNWFNLYTFTILNDRIMYEKILDDPYILTKSHLPLPKYYHELTYSFPNINFCKYKIGTRKDRIRRISLMYYVDNAEENWFKLLK